MSEHQRRKDEVTEEITTLAQEAESAVEAQRDQPADALQSFADTIQEKTGTMPGGPKTAEAASVAAEGLQRTADYIHERNPGQMAGEVKSALRSQPFVAVGIGMLIGFVIGRMTK